MYATAKSSRPAAAALALLAVIVSLLAAAAMTDRARAEDKAPARVAMPAITAMNWDSTISKSVTPNSQDAHR